MQHLFLMSGKNWLEMIYISRFQSCLTIKDTGNRAMTEARRIGGQR